MHFLTTPIYSRNFRGQYTQPELRPKPQHPNSQKARGTGILGARNSQGVRSDSLGTERTTCPCAFSVRSNCKGLAVTVYHLAAFHAADTKRECGARGRDTVLSRSFPCRPTTEQTLFPLTSITSLDKQSLLFDAFRYYINGQDVR